MVMKKAGMGELCCGKKQGSLYGVPREGHGHRLLELLVAFNLFMTHTHYENF